MLGSFGVGKTSIVRRYVHQQFGEKYFSTIGVHVNQKFFPLNKKQGEIEQLNLIIWDIAHVEKFNDVVRNYFRGSHGAIAVFDLTRKQTFEETDIFLRPFLEMNPRSKLILVGNKVDLVEQDAIEMEQFLQLTKAYRSPYSLTSAKTGENVEHIFSELVNLLIEAG